MPAPTTESLESRTLFSASLANGVLTVPGSPGADRIDVGYTYDNPDQSSLQSAGTPNLTVAVNGQFQFFTPGSVRKIVIRCGAGDDTVNVFLDLPAVTAPLPRVSVSTGGGADLLTLDGKTARVASVNTGAGRDLVVANGDKLRAAVPADDVLLRIADSGLISVRGSRTGDNIHIAQEALVGDFPNPVYDVTINGLTYTINAPTNSPRIAVDGGRGNDTISLKQGPQTDADGRTFFLGTSVSAPATLSGGAGNDTIYSGAGPTRVLGGAGKNNIFPASASTRVVGGRGRNTVHPIPAEPTLLPLQDPAGSPTPTDDASKTDDTSNPTSADQGNLTTATSIPFQYYPLIPPDVVTADGLSLTSKFPNILDHREAFSGTVATFTDERPGDVTDYSATIDWGDGSDPESAAVTRDAATGAFAVAGAHTYLFGNYTPHVTVTDLRPADADPTADASPRAVSVSHALSVFPPPVAGVGYPMNATSGQTYHSVLATYVGLDTALLPRYTAQVNWGDGQSGPATLVLNDDDSVSAVADHAYAAPGFYDVAVTLAERNAANATAGASVVRARATVADGDFAATPTAGLTSLSGTAFHGKLAFFQYLSGTHPDLAHLRAEVTFTDTPNADPATVAATLVPTADGFYVAADRLFTAAGTASFEVRVYHDTLPADSDQLTGVARGGIVVTPHLHATARAFQATAGVESRVLVAHFTSDDPDHLWSSSFTAFISWGDGTEGSPGEIVATPDGGFDVYGTHTYAVIGRPRDAYPFVNITETRTLADADAGLPAGPFTASAFPGYDAAGATRSTIAAGTFTGFYLFTDPTYGALLSASAYTGTDVADADFTASVTWADGTVTPAAIARAGDHLAITASRDDLAPGTYAATLTVDAGQYEHTLDATVSVPAPIDRSQFVLDATVTPAPVSVARGTHFHGVVATFSLNDPDPTARSEDFTASLTSGAAALTDVVTRITANGDGTFSVVADFDVVAMPDVSYANPPTVTIYRGQRSATAMWSFSVFTDPSLPALTAKSLHFRQRQQFTTTVASFTAPTDGSPGAADATRFTATIEWGDGSTSAGVITRNWDGSFDVSGTHTYHHLSGGVPVRVDLADTATGRAVNALSFVSLDHDPVEVSPGSPDVSTAGDGVVSGAMATFVDEDGPSTDPDRYRVYYAALIDWGDRHFTDGLIAQEADGSYTVASTHTYDASGEYDVNILVRRNARYAISQYLLPGGLTAAASFDTIADPRPAAEDFSAHLHLSVHRDLTAFPLQANSAPAPQSAPAPTTATASITLSAQATTPFATQPLTDPATSLLTADDLAIWG